MAWMRCRSCTALFAIGLLRCPQCQAVSQLYARPDYEDEQKEETVPKTTMAGASNALLAREPGFVPEDPAPAEEPTAVEAAEQADADAVETQADAVAESAEPESAAATPAKKQAAKKTAAKKTAAPPA